MLNHRRDTIFSMRERDRRSTRSVARSRAAKAMCVGGGVIGLMGFVVLGGAEATAHADTKVDQRSVQLREAGDFRVRTAAALWLGTSDHVDAVKPLCSCLDDEAEVESVRVACAAALGKIKKPGS